MKVGLQIASDGFERGNIRTYSSGSFLASLTSFLWSVLGSVWVNIWLGRAPPSPALMPEGDLRGLVAENSGRKMRLDIAVYNVARQLEKWLMRRSRLMLHGDILGLTSILGDIRS